MEKEIQNTLQILRSGGTIIYPTDTIWGLGCDATNQSAVDKIFKIKKREENKSLIVLVSDESMLNRFVKDVPEVAWDLIDASEKPLTIIYPHALKLAKGVAANDGSIAVRIIKDEFCQRLIHKFGKPLVSTSANFSGSPSPKDFEDIDPLLLQQVDHVVNSDVSEIGTREASSIIQLKMNGEIKIIRK